MLHTVEHLVHPGQGIAADMMDRIKDFGKGIYNQALKLNYYQWAGIFIVGGIFYYYSDEKEVIIDYLNIRSIARYKFQMILFFGDFG